MNPTTIASRYQACAEAFRVFSNALKNAQPKYLEQISSLDLQTESGRLRVWAGNQGTHRIGRSSLDHRLRQAGHIRERVIDLLEDLHNDLRDGISIVRNERPPFDEQFSDSDSSDSSNGSSDPGSSTELELILEGIRQIISYLYGLAVAIRNPTPLDRFDRSTNVDTSHFEIWDIQHASERFPLLSTASPLILQRLGKANSRRRQVFKYNMIHNSKVRHGVDAFTTQVDPVAVLPDRYLDEDQGDLEPTSLKAPNEESQRTPSIRAPTLDTQTTVATFVEKDTGDAAINFDDGLSETSSAVSDGPLDETALEIPAPPAGALEGEYFECPYCYEISRAPSTIQWRKHLFQDLQPYTCTFANCPDPNRTYSSRHEWFDHEAHVHRRQFICLECQQEFVSQRDFVQHMQYQHSAVLAQQQLSVLLDMCSRPADDMSVGKCSLCFEENQPLLRHMAHHMLSLALFSLPRRGDDEFNDDESNRGQAGASEAEEDIAEDLEALSDFDDMSEASESAVEEMAHGEQLEAEDPSSAIAIGDDQTEAVPWLAPNVAEESDDFWHRAYQISSKQHMWVSYEGFIIQELKGRVSAAAMAVMNNSQREAMVSNLILEKSDFIEEATWTTVDNPSPDIIQVSAALLFVRNQLSAGADAHRYPAFAWAGVCLLLTAVLKRDQFEFDLGQDVQEALPYITQLIFRLMAVQRIYSERNTSLGHSNLTDAIQSKDSFESQMSIFCSQVLDFQAQAVDNFVLKKMDDSEGGPLRELLLRLRKTDATCRDSIFKVDSGRLENLLVAQEHQINEIIRLQRKKWEEERSTSTELQRVSFRAPTGRETRKVQRALNSRLQTLRTSPYEIGKDQSPYHAPGTCGWVLRNPIYREWLGRQSSTILWINADPGWGKSVLSRFLFDGELRSTASVTTCYFFFAEGDSNRSSAIHALFALLHQLCNRNRALLEKVDEAFRGNGDTMTASFSWLWELLTSLAQHPEAGRIICLLDALDECEEIGRASLIASLNELHENAQMHGNRLMFLVTSRPFLAADCAFRPSILRLCGNNERETIRQEINAVILDRVPKIATENALDEQLQSALQADLSHIKNPTHLWLYLTLAAVEQAAGVSGTKQMAHFIDHIPPDTNSAYLALLKLSPQPEMASKLLHIAVAAVRPMTVREVNMALNIKEGQRFHEEVQLRAEEDFAAYINNVCAPILTIYHGKLNLIHQTVKEWWDPRRNVTKPPHPNTPSRLLVQPPQARRSDRLLAEICLIYLSFKEFGEKTSPSDAVEIGTKHGSESWYRQRRHEVLESAGTHDLLEYAATYWTHHFWSTGEHDPGLLGWWSFVCRSNPGIFDLWFRIFWYAYNMRNNLDRAYKIPKLSPLSLAAFLGDFFMVKHLVLKGEALEAEKGNCWSPLLAAINRGDEAIAMFLIEHGASATSENATEWTPLGLAAAKAFNGIVDYLINQGANVDHQTHPGGTTALIRASSAGHAATAEVLLRHGAKIDTEDNRGTTALMMAAGKGHRLVLEMLIGENANIKAYDNDGWTALHYATRSGYDVIAQILLKQGAEIEAVDEEERTPLSWASQTGLYGTTKMLLYGGADVDAIDENKLTPLLYAIKHGHDPIVQILLDHGADSEILDFEGRSALLHAIRLKNIKMIQVLLNAGANPNIVDERDQTPIVYAIENSRDAGAMTEIRMLLAAGAIIDAVDKCGRTALDCAIEKSNLSVVKELLKRGANPNLVDKDLRAPLHYATIQSKTSIIQLLLEFGAEPQLRDAKGRTPLDLAREQRQVDNARLLENLISAG